MSIEENMDVEYVEQASHGLATTRFGVGRQGSAEWKDHVSSMAYEAGLQARFEMAVDPYGEEDEAIAVCVGRPDAGTGDLVWPHSGRWVRFNLKWEEDELLGEAVTAPTAQAAIEYATRRLGIDARRLERIVSVPESTRGHLEQVRDTAGQAHERRVMRKFAGISQVQAFAAEQLSPAAQEAIVGAAVVVAERVREIGEVGASPSLVTYRPSPACSNGCGGPDKGQDVDLEHWCCRSCGEMNQAHVLSVTALAGNEREGWHAPGPAEHTAAAVLGAQSADVQLRVAAAVKCWETAARVAEQLGEVWDRNPGLGEGEAFARWVEETAEGRFDRDADDRVQLRVEVGGWGTGVADDDLREMRPWEPTALWCPGDCQILIVHGGAEPGPDGTEVETVAVIDHDAEQRPAATAAFALATAQRLRDQLHDGRLVPFPVVYDPRSNDEPLRCLIAEVDARRLAGHEGIGLAR